MAGFPKVVLSFGDARMEFEASVAQRRGGLRFFVREAEMRLGLRPGTFSIYGARGKVDSPEALQREMRASGTVCHLDVRETSDGKILQEMRASMKAMEERLLARVDEAVAAAKREMEPAMRDLAAEQERLQTRIDEVCEETLAARVDALAGEEELRGYLERIGRECEVLREADFGAQIAALATDCLAMRENAIAGEEALIRRLDDMDADARIASAARATSETHALEDQLQMDVDLQAIRDLADATRREADSAAPRKEVLALEAPRRPAATSLTAAVAAATAPATAAMCLDLGAQAPVAATAAPRLTPPTTMTRSFRELDLAFSGKACKDAGNLFLARGKLAELWDAGSTPTSSQRLFRASRSSPVLPPLQ